VAITIRNKATEELIRIIGRRTGEGPSAVIRRLAENENSRQPQGRVSEEEVKRRMRVMDELADKYRTRDAPKLSWEEIEKEMDSIFGDELDSIPRNG
jgi:Rv0623-like transcription factor